MTRYAYNNAGQPVHMTYPSGRQLSLSYRDGRVSALGVEGQALLDGISYQPFGPIAGWRWASGVTYRRQFDLDGRLVGQTLGQGQRQLDYDPAGRLIALSDPQRGQQFAYNGLDRLTGVLEMPDGHAAYTYDAVGNRLSHSQDGHTETYRYAPDSQRLLGIDGPQPRSYAYDATGNTLSDGLHRYHYDASGRLVALDGGVVRYGYNGLGQRVVTHSAGQSRYVVYDEAGRLLGEYDSQGQARWEVVYLESTPVAVLMGGRVYGIQADHLDTPRVLLEGTRVVWRWDSDPFGARGPDEDPDGDGVALAFPLRFPGQYFDAESGLHYNYFRDYDPATGRYIQSDPIGLAGGLNTYLYVGGNPLNSIDPLGLYQMCHRSLQLPLPGARHCYARFADGTTSSFDLNGVGPDPDPNNSGTICTNPQEPDKDDCIKKEMQKCAGNYNFTAFNCCHCVEQALKACDTSIPASSWPNWPINPGPQPGEPGYSPVPIYGPGLGL